MTGQQDTQTNRQMKIPSTDTGFNLSPCSCGVNPELTENRLEGRSIIQFSCPCCGKKSLPLLQDVAIEHWNQISRSFSLKRSLEYNEWGVCKSKPTQTIIEIHRSNKIRIRAFFDAGRWFYGFDIRIGQLVRTKQATIVDPTYDTIHDMKVAAKDEIKQLCEMDRKTKKIFLDFTVISYNQLDLFLLHDQNAGKEAVS